MNKEELVNLAMQALSQHKMTSDLAKERIKRAFPNKSDLIKFAEEKGLKGLLKIEREVK